MNNLSSREIKFAARVAIEAILKERKQYAVDAGIARTLGGAQNPTQQNAVQRYRELTEAMEILRKLSG